MSCVTTVGSGDAQVRLSRLWQCCYSSSRLNRNSFIDSEMIHSMSMQLVGQMLKILCCNRLTRRIRGPYYRTSRVMPGTDLNAQNIVDTRNSGWARTD